MFHLLISLYSLGHLSLRKPLQVISLFFSDSWTLPVGVNAPICFSSGHISKSSLDSKVFRIKSDNLSTCPHVPFFCQSLYSPEGQSSCI